MNIQEFFIPLKDGRKLAARLWLPESSGPSPVILEYLPYRKRDGTAPRDETTHRVFAEASYACIRVDISGTGDSEGEFDDEYSEQELSDGEELISWIADQNWCDGNIGMIGISWGGFNGLQLAYRRPEALKAIVTVASTTDRYADDIHFMGGCLLSDNVNWSSQMFAYQTRPLDPELSLNWRKEWINRLENTPFLAADWLEHPTRDEYWKHGSVCEDWSAIKTPVLAITGWADSYINAPPRLAANLNCSAKALIGPWEHRYPHISKLGAADFHSEVINWFDKWLKGESNNVESLPDYRTFMQEHFNPTKENSPRKGRWIAEQEWPSQNISKKTLQLNTDNLSNENSTGKILISCPANIGQAGGYFTPGMRVDNELAEDQAPDDALSVTFDTESLISSLEILGRPVLKIEFSVDKPVAQIAARLCDVSPQGVSQRVTYRAFNLTHFDSHETPEKLEVGKHYQAEFELNECAHHFRKGHVLRLALSNSYWPIIWPVGEKTEITLHLEGCSLTLPIRNVNKEIEPQNPELPRDYPNLQSTIIREMSDSSKREIKEDGRHTLDTFDDYGKTQDPYHDLIAGSHVHMHYEIHPNDPASAKFETKWNFTFERDDWCVEIDTECSMYCDSENFYLGRRVIATEGKDKTEVLTKEWSVTVPRGFI